MEESNFKFTDEINHSIADLGLSNFASQLVEDLNGIQKNAGSAPNRRFRRPAFCMGAALQAKAPSQKHKYDEVPMEIPAPTKSVALEKSAFDPPMKGGSLPFKTIVSTSQTPSWPSPSAERLTVAHADLFMLRRAKQHKQLRECEHAWLGSVVDVEHKVALGFPRSPKSKDLDWYLGIYNYQKSTAMLWPCSMHKAGKANLFYFELASDLKEPCFRTITSLTDVKAASYEWKSWAFQVQCLSPAVLRNLQPAIRPFAHTWKPFIEIAVEAAWWNLSRSQIYDLSLYFKLEVAAGSSLFDMLWAFCITFLNLDEEAALKIVYSRVSRSHHGRETNDALLEVEEAVEVLDQADVKEVEESKKM